MATKYPDGGKSSLIIGINPGDTTITDRADMEQRAYAFNSWDVGEAEETEENASLRASIDPPFPEDGLLSAEGSAELPITLDGMLPILQQATGDPSPTSTALSDKTLVASATALAETVNVVSDGDLDPGTDLTVDDDLSDVKHAATLTGTPQNTPPPMTSGGDGTVTIAYRNANGSTGTIVLTYVAGSLTTAATGTLPAGATITGITPSDNWDAGHIDITASVNRLRESYWQAAGNTDVDVVDGQNLAGAGNKTIADSLAGYHSALTVTVTLDTAALTDNAIPGTVDIQYTEADGSTEEENLSFANTVLTTPQTFTLPADAYISRVRTTGFGSGTFDITVSVATKLVRNPEVGTPGKLRIQLSGAQAGGRIEITGLRRAGLKSTSVLRQFEKIDLDTATDITSEKLFHELLDFTVYDSSGGVVLTGTVELTSRPDGFETEFELSDELPPSLTGEAELAEIPWRYEKLRFSTVTFNFGSPNSIGLDIIASRVDEERTIEGGHNPQYVATRALYPTEFPFVTRRILPSWGGYLVLDDQVLLFDGLTLTFASGLVFSEGRQAERFREDVERETRVISASFGVYFYTGTASADVYTQWQELFRDREGFDVRASAFHWPVSGRQHELRLTMPNMLLSGPVGLPVSERGRVNRTVEATAFPTDDATTPDNAKIVWVGSESW